MMVNDFALMDRDNNGGCSLVMGTGDVTFKVDFLGGHFL